MTTLRVLLLGLPLSLLPGIANADGWHHSEAHGAAVVASPHAAPPARDDRHNAGYGRERGYGARHDVHGSSIDWGHGAYGHPRGHR